MEINAEEIEDIMQLPDEFVQFKIENEKWHVYELKDGTIIRTKYVLMSILAYGEKDPDGKRPSRFGHQNLVVIHSPIALRGEKDRTWDASELEEFVTERNLMFRLIKDGGINNYNTEKQTFKWNIELIESIKHQNLIWMECRPI